MNTLWTERKGAKAAENRRDRLRKYLAVRKDLRVLCACVWFFSGQVLAKRKDGRFTISSETNRLGMT
jgi:hypothetical protein